MAVELNTGFPTSDGAHLTLRARLRETLRQQIVGGHWKTDDRLPSENELMHSTGMSRITVRQALADLAADGLIVRVQGKGSFVAPAPVRQELSRLQGLSEALAHQGRSVHTRVLFLGASVWPTRVAEAMGTDAGAPCVELRTLRFADGRPLSLNTTWIEQSVGQGIDARMLEGSDLLTLYEAGHPLRVAQALVDIRAALATPEQGQQLQLGTPAAVLHVDRSVFAAAGRPLHFESSVYRADAFTYRMELAR